MPKLKLWADKPTRGPVPVPLKVTVCVLPTTPLLLSVMVSAPVSGPVAVGEKVTLIAQEPLAATLLPQLLVSSKLALVAMLVMVSAALPVLVRVTVCAVLLVPTNCGEKVRGEDGKLATGAVPVPVKGTICGLLGSLSVIVTFPVRIPTAVGVNVTVIVQLPPAPTDVPQVFV